LSTNPHLLVVILYVPLGNYMARVHTDGGHWHVERVIYRLIGAQPDNRQTQSVVDRASGLAAVKAASRFDVAVSRDR
jgi:K+-transporting ATPase A subunit